MRSEPSCSTHATVLTPCTIVLDAKPGGPSQTCSFAVDYSCLRGLPQAASCGAILWNILRPPHQKHVHNKALHTCHQDQLGECPAGLSFSLAAVLWRLML